MIQKREKEWQRQGLDLTPLGYKPDALSIRHGFHFQKGKIMKILNILQNKVIKSIFFLYTIKKTVWLEKPDFQKLNILQNQALKLNFVS